MNSMRSPARHHATAGFILPVALFTMVILLLLGTTMLVKSTSEMNQAGNSQYASQARGQAEAAQADMFTQMANPGPGIVNATLLPYLLSFQSSGANSKTTPIIPSSSVGSILASLQSSFPTISNTQTTPPSTTQASIVFRSLRPDVATFAGGLGQVYYLDYSIVGRGTSGQNVRTVTTEGTMRINLGRAPLNIYSLLADDGGSGGTTFNGGFFDSSASFNGPVHFNRNLALTGSPQFLKGLTVSESTVFMNNATNCSNYAFTRIGGSTSSPSGCTSVNTGGAGITYSTPVIPLPTNARSQGRASLGLNPLDTSAISGSEACASLSLGSGCNSVPNGTYLPRSGTQMTGGIYVQGDANVTLSIVAGNQVYTIQDGSGTSTITVNTVTNTTTLVKNNIPTVLTGVPNGQLYVSGNITGLGGPARTAGSLPTPLPTSTVPAIIPPAIASATALNVAAGGQVKISGDLTYQDNPIANPNAKNILGVISGTGNINIASTAPSDIYIQGALLTGTAGTGLGVDNYNTIGNKGGIHLLGSLAESTDQIRALANGSGGVATGYADDFNFDQRFASGAVSPPFFPATTVFSVTAGWPIQRTWAEQ